MVRPGAGTVSGVEPLLQIMKIPVIEGKPAIAALITLAAAVLGGALAQWVGLPLPWLLGSLLATAGLAIGNVKIFGQEPGVPIVLRQIAIPVIGVMIGATVKGDIVHDMLGWWPSLLLLVPFALLVQLANFMVLWKLGRYDVATAFFGASPGGLIEALLLGERKGGNPALMSMQHFARIALCVAVIPVIFTFWTGEVVGSAAGIQLGGGGALPSARDSLLLLVAGTFGYFAASRLHFPAAIMTGPLILSAIFHVAGITDAGVPTLLVQGAQLVMGVTIGQRFTGQRRRTVVQALGLACVAASLSIGVAFGVAVLLSRLGVAGLDAVFLAYAPGGMSEMSLVAISIGANPVFVTAHHIIRIIAAVMVSNLVFDRLVRWIGGR